VVLVVAFIAKDGESLSFYVRLIINAEQQAKLPYSCLFSSLVPEISMKEYCHSNHLRFFGRLLSKTPENYSLNMLIGNILLSGKNHYSALSHVSKAYACSNGSALSKFMLGVLNLHISMKRNTKNRNHLLSTVSKFKCNV
jgi:hypothetical protein